MLAVISLVTGVAAGSMALVQARKQPENRKQMVGVACLAFGMAALMAVMFVF
jgi:hypothetical protein